MSNLLYWQQTIGKSVQECQAPKVICVLWCNILDILLIWWQFVNNICDCGHMWLCSTVLSTIHPFMHAIKRNRILLNYMHVAIVRIVEVYQTVFCTAQLDFGLMGFMPHKTAGILWHKCRIMLIIMVNWKSLKFRPCFCGHAAMCVCAFLYCSRLGQLLNSPCARGYVWISSHSFKAHTRCIKVYRSFAKRLETCLCKVEKLSPCANGWDKEVHISAASDVCPHRVNELILPRSPDEPCFLPLICP